LSAGCRLRFPRLDPPAQRDTTITLHDIAKTIAFGLALQQSTAQGGSRQYTRFPKHEHGLTLIERARESCAECAVTTVDLSDSDLRLLLEACRALATRYARDADHVRNPVIRRVLVDGAAEIDALAARLQEASDRIKAARFKPGPEPSASNVRPIRRE
jgi:hypothetical protein